MTIYLPSTDYACYVAQDANTIRAYETMPRQGGTSAFTDYYINSHYIYKNGNQSWGATYANMPTCMGATFTTNVMYRNDIADIMITFFILLLVCFYFPYRIISRLFGRWLKW